MDEKTMTGFETQVIPKRTKDVSGMEDKILSMYAKGMSRRDISETIDEIYGFEILHETISKITDRVSVQVEEWQNRPLKKFYTFLFVDCMYVTIKKEYETKSCAVYVILGYDVNGIKDILGLWISESEGKHNRICLLQIPADSENPLQKFGSFQTGRDTS